MDIQLLYRWSTAAQFVSVIMIALFYGTLARSLRRPEVSWWVQSWVCNAVALGVTVSFWFFTPSAFVANPVRALYVAGKVAYALLLVQGAWALIRQGAFWLKPRTLWTSIAGAAAIGAIFLVTIDRIGVAVQGSMGLLFVWCGVMLLRARGAGTIWLAIGFILRGGFALVEGVAYLADALPVGTVPPAFAHFVSLFLGAHSSVDLAGEWLLALGGVLALARRSQSEIEVVNTELVSAQQELRRLADRDPLTGLVNRRAMPDAFRAAYETGAALVFCDLDGLKQINDTLGHSAGDAALVRFADALRASFRPDDTLVRFAGDEFLVICRGMELAMAHSRVERVRARLGEADERSSPLHFCAGVVALSPGEDPAVALKAADAAMYAAKPAVPSSGDVRPATRTVVQPIV